MDVFQLRAGRYLLYLDILGFKHIVQTRTPREVYDIVDKVVGEFRKRGDRIQVFRTLYFSDTIIFYQEPVGPLLTSTQSLGWRGLRSLLTVSRAEGPSPSETSTLNLTRIDSTRSSSGRRSSKPTRRNRPQPTVSGSASPFAPPHGRQLPTWNLD